MKRSFVKRGRHCDVTVSKTQLRCTPKNNLGPNFTFDIDLNAILAVENQTLTTPNTHTTVIHYGSSKKNNTLSWERLVLSGDPELGQNLNHVLSSALADRHKPKSLLVVINPNSGKKSASRVFHKKVAPLFKACNIRFQIYETTGHGDGRNALQNVDFSTLDGVIAVGGDGLLSEVLTACVLKQQQLLGNSADDPDVNLTPIPFPVGVIPAGTGNYTAKYLHGSVDVVTSAIKIVLGQTTPLNIASVHQGYKLEGICHLLSSFGLIGDMMYSCEKYRWMGNVRFKILPFRTIFRRRLIDAVVEFQKENTREWQSVRGSFYSIETHICDLIDRDSKLVPMFADSALTLHMTSACTLGDHIKQLVKVADQTAGAYNYHFIQVERVLKYRVSLPTTESQERGVNLANSFYMNLDGEPLLVNKSNFQVSLHHGVLKVFGDTRPCDQSNDQLVTKL